MDSGQERLLQFDRDLLSGKNICSSEGIFINFPPSLKKPFQMKGLGLIICHQGFARVGRHGGADFDLSDRTYPGYYGESGCFHVYVFPPYSRRTFLCLVYW